jgi:nucleotide-binding universal stress UspA family protein
MRQAIIRVAADGSPGSRRALVWAIDEAQLRGCGVELVGVYAPVVGDQDRAKAAAEAAVHQTMDDIVAGRADLPLVSWHVVAGDVADVLTRESANSVLLVMGSHDLRGLRHGARESVTDLCTRTSAVPVVVLPPPPAAERTSRELETGAQQ